MVVLMRRLLGDWRLWYGIGLLLIASLFVLILLFPDPKQETDVLLLPVFLAQYAVWMAGFGCIVLLIACGVLNQKYLARIGIFVFVATLLSLTVALFSPTLSRFYQGTVEVEGQTYHRRSIIYEGTIIYNCDRLLLDCDVVERYSAVAMFAEPIETEFCP